MQPGPMNLITDVAGVCVGHGQDDALKSGVSVVTADAPMVAAVDVMGGAPGTRETDMLAADKTVAAVDALVLSGGSAFGLDAASGVVDALHRAGRGFAVGDATVPIVPAAILFDLLNGGDKGWDTNPYAALGRRAMAATTDQDFALGSIGAGTGATTAGLKGGLGSASVVLDGGITVGALVAVNAVGSATLPDHSGFWAAPFEMGAEFGGYGSAGLAGAGAQRLPLKTDVQKQAQNTTIAIVATDATLSKPQAKRVAVAAQDGIARAIIPAHTPMDGDLVFAAATGAKPLGDPVADVLHIGHAAAICLARAIARGVYHATPAPGDVFPCFRS